MTMDDDDGAGPEKIEPALTAEEWTKREVRTGSESSMSISRIRPVVRPDTELVSLYIEDFDAGTSIPRDEAPAAIALLNDILPDADPRKITRAIIAMLQEADTALVVASKHAEYRSDAEECARLARLVGEFASALASLLPPER